MSQNNRNNGRTHARHPRHSVNTNRKQRSEDERVLAKLPYRKGHLTDHELTLFAQLRYELTAQERRDLTRVAKTLRRPPKRLKALDLMRYWGQTLTPAQHRMLPWFAGLTWHRPLPSGSTMTPVQLAKHLLCKQDVPTFLLEPFAHPQRYPGESMHWSLSRMLATIGSGGGLCELRAIDRFWARVPPDVYALFMATPADMPVIQGLIGAFVAHWDGPPWLAKQAASWSEFGWFDDNLASVLRVAHDVCVQGLSREQTRQSVDERLAAIPRYNRNFGSTHALPIADVMPVELHDWTCHELRFPDDFEAEQAMSGAWVVYYFHDAQRGRLSFWSLRQQDQHLTVRVDVSRMRASLVTPDHRPSTPTELRVVGQWASANGMTT